MAEEIRDLIEKIIRKESGPRRKRLRISRLRQSREPTTSLPRHGVRQRK